MLNDYLQYQELEHGLAGNTISAYRRDIKEFIKLAGLRSNFNIPTRTVNQYLTHLNQLNRRPASIARKISSLKGFFGYLVEKNIAAANPFEHLRSPRLSRYHPEYLSVSEIEEILRQPDLKTKAGIRDLAILELLYGTGMRISELINLRLAAVYDEVGFIKIIGKGNKERLVPYGSHARTAVARYIEEIREDKKRHAQSDVLFLSNRNRKFSRVAVWKIIKKYAARAEISKPVTPHTFRHSFATHMIEGGADLRTVQELLGHTSITTTQIYTRIDKEYLLTVHRDYHPRERKTECKRD